MAGDSSRTGAGRTTHRHRYHTLPDSDMADNDGFKIPPVEGVDDLFTEEGEEPVKQRWWTRERLVHQPK